MSERKQDPRCKYKPEYCELVIERAKEGRSLESFSAFIGAGRTTVYDWRQRYPEFEEAVQIAKLHQQAWWEDRALDIATGAKGSHVLVMFALKNVDPVNWRDRQEIEVTNNPIAEAMDYFEDDDE